MQLEVFSFGNSKRTTSPLLKSMKPYTYIMDGTVESPTYKSHYPPFADPSVISVRSSAINENVSGVPLIFFLIKHG